MHNGVGSHRLSLAMHVLRIPIASPKQTITYTCVASNNGSCFARDQITIHVMCNGANLFVPNTFTPNNDGVNDRFFPRGKGVFNIKSMRLFNRWGQVVYERNSFLPNVEGDGWDGTFKGMPLASDVYVYMIEIICDNNTDTSFQRQRDTGALKQFSTRSLSYTFQV